ncbi:transposase, partial [Escherichia coli]|uniref:transposase n=1 Tax=Escherichia coli TaxID=562 RepID=UPI00301CDEC8
KNLKTPQDLSQFYRLLKKLRVEAALNAEMTHDLGYEKNQSRPRANSRNGYSTKTVITGDGPLELRTPRDRDGTFEPQLVKKNQTRITGMDNQILSLYAKGMTTREIPTAFKELFDGDVSPALISNDTDAVTVSYTQLRAHETSVEIWYAVFCLKHWGGGGAGGA